ncbi:MAG: amino acid permease [Melioribacteraceae bacterium]|nr:amino acid permease [Melioribacteraceae bacterium]MCF8354425.1 amino acid permease [Melioribacteraceae bacterium]MCF8394035.1 amino acid permease [Melioribacteraceae bacterium]MCF8419801.1 amino acid permease [Melioribacteraceae bacterium]
MVQKKKTKVLNKELGLLGVFSIAAGTTLSAGFFLLPGLAAKMAGPAVALAYFIAVLPLIPAMFSILELSTAMPRAGGVYYFLDRSLGPMFGTIGAIGTWFALILKVAFALIGMGAYLSLFIDNLPILPVAIGFAVLLGILNIFGTQRSGKFQTYLVAVLLVILAIFVITGSPSVNFNHFNDFFGSGFDSILATAGFVYISYVGLTKVASLSEEVRNPDKNLPVGVFAALGIAVLVYILGISIMVGVLPMDELSGSLTPVADAAFKFSGIWGVGLVTIAALVAFISVANAGTLSASRYPFAMSRDHLLPAIFKNLSSRGTPVYAIIITTTAIILILILFDPMKIAKLASAFQLLMFALVCVAVIVMRESKIDSYDPGYKSPLYPWMQILGVILPLFLIVKMGFITIAFSAGLIIAGITWYMIYAHKRVTRAGAIFHIFERLGRQRYHGLDVELRGILKEKGLRENDPFDDIVSRSNVLDIDEVSRFDDITDKVSEILSKSLPYSKQEIKNQFMEGTRIGITPVTHGMALPHLRIKGIEQSELFLVRCSKGTQICFKNPMINDKEEEQTVNAIFYLVSPESNPTQHLRLLAQIAGRVDEDSFMEDWLNAKTEQEIKNALIHDERWLSLSIRKDDATAQLDNTRIQDCKLPQNCLVALIRRGGKTFVPKGDTDLHFGDRLTIIGDPISMKQLQLRFLGAGEITKGPKSR